MVFERIIEGKDHLWLNACRQFLVDNGVFDSDSFISLTEEDEL